MTTYTIHLRTDAGFALREIEAETAEAALVIAREYDPDILDFERYEYLPVNEITVCDQDGNELIEWYDDEVRLRLASQDLLEAAKKVVSRWQRGDLAAAIRELDTAIAKATGGG